MNEIGHLRDINVIYEKDIDQLKIQVEQLICQKQELIEDLDQKLMDIQKLFRQKQDEEKNNARLTEEVQNLRFML